MNQLALPIHSYQHVKVRQAVEPQQTLSHHVCDQVAGMLSQDLSFAQSNGNHGSHTFHAFPAKFPPELPRRFIESLTQPGDVVLDPMSGSGTTVLEAALAGRTGIGFDIDPLALLMARVKVGQFDKTELHEVGKRIVNHAAKKLWSERAELEKLLNTRWDQATHDFIAYWFVHETQLELLALITEIENIPVSPLRSFFELAFSAIIITKSGGVSLAMDLAHTRPHRVKRAKSPNGVIIFDDCAPADAPRKIEILTKTLRSPLDDFGKRVQQNAEHLLALPASALAPKIEYGNAQALPLNDASVDLIVTSPPYASNAIDYMRAHKFSLVWLGHPISALGQQRKGYIGGEAVTGATFEDLPPHVTSVVAAVANARPKKGSAVARYYSEMTRTLREMWRVLKPGKVAIVVVGNSILSGQDTQIQTCLAEIGQALGFQVPKIGVRQLDRNRRMMPVGMKVDKTSIIQQRMHEDYLIGFYKPPIQESSSA